MTAPGTFTSKTSTGGTQPHLVLTGANGEPVVWSETYTSPQGPQQALEVIVRTVLAAANTVLDPDEYHLDSDEAVGKVTAHLLVQ